MKRPLAGWCVCALALASGVLTAGLAAANRARGDELDRLERWCEAQSRRNELARVENHRQECHLLFPGSARLQPGSSPLLRAATEQSQAGAWRSQDPSAGNEAAP